MPTKTEQQQPLLVEEDTFYRLRTPLDVDGETIIGICKELLDNGKAHTLDEHVANTQGTNIKVFSAPELFHLARYLVQYKDDILVRHVLDTILKKDFNENIIVLDTRFAYTVSGSDYVIHNKGRPTEQRVETQLSGPSGYLEALVATQSLGSIGTQIVPPFLVAVFEQITGRKVYLSRFPEKPSKKLERAVVLGRNVNGSGFSIYCNDIISSNGPARGAVIVGQKISTETNPLQKESAVTRYSDNLIRFEGDYYQKISQDIATKLKPQTKDL